MTSKIDLDGKKALIVGIDENNKRLARWLPSRGVSVTLADPRNAGELADDLMELIATPNVSFALSNQGLELLDDVDMLCLSETTALDGPVLHAAHERHLPIKTETALFLELCPTERVIGIGGSVGKSTTVALLKAMATKSDVNVHGNGIDLNLLADISATDMVVLELPSVKLENCSASPTIGALLNIMPTQLSRYGSIDVLMRVMANIFYHQHHDNLYVYNYDDVLLRASSEHAQAEHACFSIHSLVPDGACLAGSRIILSGLSSPTNMAKVICSASDVALPGEHNMRNVVAACAIAGALGIDPAAISETVRTFRSIPHHMEIVQTDRGATWINDSVATSPDRVLTSLHSFAQPVLLILGGRDLDADWGDAARAIVERSKAVICYGKDAGKIAEMVERTRRLTVQRELDYVEAVDELDRAVERMAEISRDGDVVLFSPGAAPDAFPTLEARGKRFVALVKALPGNAARS